MIFHQNHELSYSHFKYIVRGGLIGINFKKSASSNPDFPEVQTKKLSLDDIIQKSNVIFEQDKNNKLIFFII